MNDEEDQDHEDDEWQMPSPRSPARKGMTPGLCKGRCGGRRGGGAGGILKHEYLMNNNNNNNEYAAIDASRAVEVEGAGPYGCSASRKKRRHRFNSRRRTCPIHVLIARRRVGRGANF